MPRSIVNFSSPRGPLSGDEGPRGSVVEPQTDESSEVRFAGGGLAMSLAADVCGDDRPAVDPPGLLLRRQRESRAMTLDDVARATKISKSVLRALETSDVIHLPAPIYTRGFVKAYAQEVGLPPDDTAELYLQKSQSLRDHHLLVDDGTAPPVARSERRVDAGGDAQTVMATNQVQRITRLAIAAACVSVVMYLVSFSREQDSPPGSASSIADAPDVAHAAMLSGEERPAGDALVSTLSHTPLRVEFAPDGPCWLSVRIDGETVVARLLQAGDRETIELEGEAVVRVGEPGTLSYSINGQSGRALGPAGQPVTVRITKDNFRDFLSS